MKTVGLFFVSETATKKPHMLFKSIFLASCALVSVTGQQSSCVDTKVLHQTSGCCLNETGVVDALIIPTPNVNRKDLSYAATVTVPNALSMPVTTSDAYAHNAFWKVGTFETLDGFPSEHFGFSLSNGMTNDGSSLNDAYPIGIDVAYPPQYDPQKTYPTILFIEGSSGANLQRNLPIFAELASRPGYYDAFSGTNLQHGAFIVQVTPYVSSVRRSLWSIDEEILDAEYAGRGAYLSNYMKMMTYEILPYLTRRYKGIAVDRDHLTIVGGSNTGIGVLRIMLEYPEFARNGIAHSPVFPSSSSVHPIDGSEVSLTKQYAFAPNASNPGQAVHHYDPALHTRATTYFTKYARRVRESGLDITLVTFNNAIVSWNGMDGDANPSNIWAGEDGDPESRAGAFTPIIEPILRANGFDVAPAVDDEAGVPGDRLLSSARRVFSSDVTKSMAKHAYVQRYSFMHEFLCKIYGVPDATFSHTQYANTITYEDKTFNLYNLSATFTGGPTPMDQRPPLLSGHGLQLHAITGPSSSPVQEYMILYATEDVDLLDYALGNANNGNDNGGPENAIVTESYTVSAGQFVTLYRNPPFGGGPDLSGILHNSATGPKVVFRMVQNGNDVIQLWKKKTADAALQSSVTKADYASLDWQLVDQFGEVGVDGTSTPWDYTNGFAQRKTGTGPRGAFLIDDWDVQKGNLLQLRTSPPPEFHTFSDAGDIPYTIAVQYNQYHPRVLKFRYTLDPGPDEVVFENKNRMIRYFSPGTFSNENGFVGKVVANPTGKSLKVEVIDSHYDVVNTQFIQI